MVSIYISTMSFKFQKDIASMYKHSPNNDPTPTTLCHQIATATVSVIIPNSREIIEYTTLFIEQTVFDHRCLVTAKWRQDLDKNKTA